MAMGGRLWKVQVLGVLLVALQAVSPLGVLSLNTEGQLLMQWKTSSLTYTDTMTPDPTQSWKASDATPCNWTGISCTNGSVSSINLNNHLALNGTLPQNIFGEFLHTPPSSIDFLVMSSIMLSLFHYGSQSSSEWFISAESISTWHNHDDDDSRRPNDYEITSVFHLQSRIALNLQARYHPLCRRFPSLE